MEPARTLTGLMLIVVVTTDRRDSHFSPPVEGDGPVCSVITCLQSDPWPHGRLWSTDAGPTHGACLRARAAGGPLQGGRGGRAQQAAAAATFTFTFAARRPFGAFRSLRGFACSPRRQEHARGMLHVAATGEML